MTVILTYLVAVVVGMMTGIEMMSMTKTSADREQLEKTYWNGYRRGFENGSKEDREIAEELIKMAKVNRDDEI